MLPLQKRLSEIEEMMKKSVDATVREFSEIRTGRANPSLVEGIMVECYGSNMPLKQVASISVPEPRLIAIHPWDPSNIQAIEKAILKSQLGINPMNDGKIIRVPIPSLTKERCDELKKVLHKIAEQGRISIRTVRRDGIDSLKKMEDSKQIPEDARFKGQDHVQKMTEKYTKRIEELLEQKEKELTSI
ncbi:MAG: ribosome recycling factor [Candidatus Omnitrophica bacterium]|nr:ribosome recycling factor [Candidatus Omnitrophota bacterium]